MVTLFDQFNGRVRGKISEEVPKDAVGGLAYGKQTMDILIEKCEETICDFLSVDVIRPAAENQRSVGQILVLLHRVCEEIIKKFIEILKESHAGICESLSE